MRADLYNIAMYLFARAWAWRTLSFGARASNALIRSPRTLQRTEGAAAMRIEMNAKNHILKESSTCPLSPPQRGGAADTHQKRLRQSPPGA